MPEHINRFAIALQSLSQDSDGHNISMKTQLKITYKDYDLADPFSLRDKVNKLRDNLTNLWFLYDGLREHTQKGSGVVFSSGPFTEPPGYSISYLIYCK